jgi:hypothetical protein
MAGGLQMRTRILGLALVLVAAWVVTVGPADAAQKITEVLVTNDATRPVPIAGKVSLADGTAVALAPGSQVGLAPDSEVGLAPGSTVEIGDSPIVAEQAGEPVHIPVLAQLIGDEITSSQVIYTVPPGKRFVAEYVNLATLLEAELHPLVQIDFRSPVLGRVFVPFEEYPISTLTDWVASEPLTAYADEGSEIKLFFTRRQGGSINASLGGVITGRLVDAP